MNKPRDPTPQQEPGLRRRALMGAAPASAEWDADARKLLQELQVHRVELELQNAELQETRAELEASLQRYTDLYEFAPIGYFTLDRSGLIEQVNLAGAALLARNRSEVAGRRFGVFLDQQSRRDFADVLDRVFAGLQEENCELLLQGSDAPRRTLQFTATADPSGRACHAVVSDITERKHAERELEVGRRRYQEQWEELQAIYESAPIGLCVLDRNLRYVRINRRLAEMNGASVADHIGKALPEMIPGLARRSRKIAKTIFRTGRMAADAEFTGNTPAQPDRTRTWNTQWLPLKDADGRIDGISVVVEDITEHKAAEEQIKHLAFYDALTELPNRRLLLDRLRQALASSTRTLRHGALLFVDLDDFKVLNDTLGHDQGDRLLQQVARRLKASVRECDTVARIGGDEFVVMLEDLKHGGRPPEGHARVVAEKILAVLNRPYVLAGREYVATASIGTTLFVNHRDTVDELMKQADVAMYQAKSAGGNTFRFFDPAMQAALEARASLESELRAALQAGQFQLHYQPQVDDTGRVTGVEALLRWQHPGRGLVLPSEFLEVAEETGQIRPLGQWVLETGCRQLVVWKSRPETADLTLAVNISAFQFRHTEFVAQVLAVLDQTGADPRKLKLELSESVLQEDADDALAKMRALKARGVGFSLGDFGTGYSSLSHLKQLPLDELKIDRSFVRSVCVNPHDAALTRMILSLGKTLGLAVVAEGVETRAQEDFLVSHGCKTFQGYRFGRPVPTEALRPNSTAFAGSSDADASAPKRSGRPPPRLRSP